MKLYNTLTRDLEPVTTSDGIFRMYICGVTPYDTTHLGHAFNFVCFDILARYLEYKGYRTVRVENVTDIDDDILRQAKKVGMRWDELAREETRKYRADMRALNVRPPDHYVWATQEIAAMQEMISTLLERGYAYEKNGSVYYDVRADQDFGQLAKMGYADMLATANERGNYPDDPNKRDPLDFVLWQAAQPGGPTWDSPWGKGRPGWHIECSAMSTRYLGPTVDIHAGGADLIFPHHDCEIAQSEHSSGVKPFVRYWFHVAMVRYQGEKMSKSLGNMLFVKDLLETYSADALRLYLAKHHYREDWSADDAEQGLEEAQAQVTRWAELLARAGAGEHSLDPEPYEKAFRAAMDDDLDTPRAVGHLESLANAIAECLEAGDDVIAAQVTLRTLAGVLGLRLEDPHLV